MANKHGMNWARQDLRLALYLRDGMACCWCGLGVEDGAQLTLDHLTPRESGGSNEATNLVTACHRCNSLRQNRNEVEFAKAVAKYLGPRVDPGMILDHISEARFRPLDRAEARRLIALRGSAAKVLSAHR